MTATMLDLLDSAVARFGDAAGSGDASRRRDRRSSGVSASSTRRTRIAAWRLREPG